jgi:hypothetical protein
VSSDYRRGQAAFLIPFLKAAEEIGESVQSFNDFPDP